MSQPRLEKGSNYIGIVEVWIANQIDVSVYKLSAVVVRIEPRDFTSVELSLVVPDLLRRSRNAVQSFFFTASHIQVAVYLLVRSIIHMSSIHSLYAAPRKRRHPEFGLVSRLFQTR
jgi:hypothetical protein